MRSCSPVASMPWRIAAACIFAAAFCVSSAIGRAQSGATPQRTVRDGVFSEAQAARGKLAYEANTCTRCHLDTLEGREQGGGGNGGAPLRGQRFVQDFGESKLSKLVSKIRVDKPMENPGTLPSQMALDIAAYILLKNDYPAGRTELSNETANTTWIPGPPGAAGLANYEVVTSIGCLYHDPSNSWLLRNAAALTPVDPASSADRDRSAGPSTPSTNTFRLLDAYHYDAASHADHTVKVVGYLVRMGAEIRITVTTLQTVAPNCAN
jgi:hypothetical protein